MMRPIITVVGLLPCLLPATVWAQAFSGDTAKAAQAFRQGTAVSPQPDGAIVCEAEEFQPAAGSAWQARNWGTNYYAATFANAFLSRRAYLGAPEVCEPSSASIDVEVGEAGRYLVLVRYEAVYRFETQFRVQVEQNGKLVLGRLYGARDNLKIWPFREGLKKEVAWSWGADENVVWEGHDAFAELQPGRAKVTLIAAKQPGHPAKRNVDLVLLTKNVADVQQRLEKENYLPLDGLLTQVGDVFARVHNAADGAAVTVTFPPCTEHSPYWVHLRTWKPLTATVEPGQSSDWLEVGSLLDTLNDGQWNVTAAANPAGGMLHYTLEVGVRNAKGEMGSVAKFESRAASLPLAFDADTRYMRRIRTSDAVLYELLDYIKRQPVQGKLPQRTLIYASIFDKRPGDDRYNAAVDEFSSLFGITSRDMAEVAKKPQPTGYVDVRGNPKDEALYKKWQAEGVADKIAVVSLGDEIGLPSPPANDQATFHAWLKSQGLKPADIVPTAGDWTAVAFDVQPATAKSQPRLFYWSKRYSHHYGIEQQKQFTDFIKGFLPNAHIGANFSPHHGYHYLGETFQWVTLFRRGGMTLPWSEDYIWQVPVASPQVNFLCLDLFRAGLKGRPDAKIHYYVMPHWGNTPDAWRRQFYGDIGHGAKIFDLFEFRPVQAAYTENHADDPEMYVEIRRSFHELGTFEDFVQDGRVRPAEAALWFSETGDIWDNHRPPFAAGKRTLYVGIRHQQMPLDIVTDEDALDGTLAKYKVLYLTDRNVPRSASQKIAEWVRAGGFLFATAGAGMLDEYNDPNLVLRELLGIDEMELVIAEDRNIVFEKQDLPFSSPIDFVTAPFAPGGKPSQMPVIACKSRIVAKGATIRGTFQDGSPALTLNQPAGSKGGAYYAAFLPGLTYFHPAIPLKPVDRGATRDSMTHFLPTQFEPSAAHLLSLPIDAVTRPVVSSEPLVESTVLESAHGTLIPLINWSGTPVSKLTVTLNIAVPGEPRLASGKPVQSSMQGHRRILTLDLDVADALIVKRP